MKALSALAVLVIVVACIVVVAYMESHHCQLNSFACNP